MTFLLLLLLLFGLCGTAHLVFGGDEALNLDCNNGIETIFCQLETEKCSEYNLTIQNDENVYFCPLQLCNNKCCCSYEVSFTFDDNFTVKVCRESKEVEIKTINTSKSFKAKAPRLVSVEESNGNVEIKWETNMDDWFNSWLTAEVTFSKQEDMMDQNLVFRNITPAMDEKLQYYVVNGKDLESDTTYMIRVRSVTVWNKMYSDSSNVKMIKTSPSPDSQVWPLIIGLSGFAVLLSVFMVWSFVKMKRKWWDFYSEPKMTISHLIKSQVITQMAPDKISTCVTEEEMSKRRWTSAMQDEMLPLSPEILEANQESGCLQDILNKSVSGSGDMFNHTYSLLLPNCSGQQKTSCLEEQLQTEARFGSVCSPNTSDLVNNPDRLARLFPAQLDGSSLVPTEKSRQFIEFPRKGSHAEGFGIFGDTGTVACGEQKTGVERFDMCFEKASKHESPFYGCLPDNSRRFLPVNAAFQPFPSQVEQPDALLLEKRSVCFEHFLKKCPEESLNKIPQPHFPPFIPGFLNNTQNVPCHAGLVPPLSSMMSGGNSLKVNCDYHSV